MKKMFLLLSTLVIAALFTSACSKDKTESPTSPSQKQTLTISAAVSLKDAMDLIQSHYQDVHPEVTLNFNFGGSGSLQQQITQGAPVDLFFSAAEDKFDILREEGIISKEDQVDLLGNELVLIVPKDKQSIQHFDELTKQSVKQIAIGTPETVPAGKYTKEALENMKIWSLLEDKMIYTKDVRQVLSYVETGNVDAGVVYKTDALSSDQVDIVATANPESHTPIVYPVGLLKNAQQYEVAKEFYTYLQSDEALKVFEEYGFISQ